MLDVKHLSVNLDGGRLSYCLATKLLVHLIEVNINLIEFLCAFLELRIFLDPRNRILC